jgi:hypothetical protein
MKAYRGVDVYTQVFLTSALVEGEFHLHALAALPSVPTGQEAGWASKPVWTTRRRENS